MAYKLICALLLAYAHNGSNGSMAARIELSCKVFIVLVMAEDGRRAVPSMA
jgi:hypothetical protein